MNKAEIAAYLVSLNSLIEAQEKAGANLRSGVLAVEYERHYQLLKDIIQKEQENETRKSQPQ